MDGVLWRRGVALPGVAEFFVFVRQRQIPFALATNNSMRTVEDYVEKLNSLGVPAGPEQVITSAVAAADYISQRYPTDTPVYIIGENGIRQALAHRGFREDWHRAQLVVVGLDEDLTYRKLSLAVLRIHKGADFIGTNADSSFPIPDGIAPGAGSLLAAIQAATGVKPLIIGKPERAMFDVAVQRLGTPAGQTLMIGDRLETDILGAQKAGLKTALVLTGVTTPEQAQSDPIQADFVFQSLVDLRQAWEISL
jgi:4-nitrophenyl phosphatase